MVLEKDADAWFLTPSLEVTTSSEKCGRARICVEHATRGDVCHRKFRLVLVRTKRYRQNDKIHSASPTELKLVRITHVYANLLDHHTNHAMNSYCTDGGGGGVPLPWVVITGLFQ